MGVKIQSHLASPLLLSAILLLRLSICLGQASDVSDNPMLEAAQAPVQVNKKEDKSAEQTQPSGLSWGLRVDEGDHGVKITDADMAPVLNNLLRRIMASANSTSIRDGDGGVDTSSKKGILVPLRVPLQEPSVNLTSLGPFRIPLLQNDNPIKGVKQFGVLSENGQKYRNCIRRQQEQFIWNRKICMPNLKRGKGSLNSKRNKKRKLSSSPITDDSIDSLDVIPWSQKVLKLIMDGKEIDDFLDEESSQLESYEDSFEEDSVTSLDKEVSTLKKSEEENLKSHNEELSVSEKDISNGQRSNNSKQMRKKKKKKRKRGSDAEARCGYTYGVEPGDTLKFKMPKNDAFCEALFVPMEGTSLSFSCKKFKLSLDCSQEYVYLSNGIYEVFYCGEDGPGEASDLQSVYMMYERNRYDSGKSKLHCTVKGQATTSTGGTDSGGNGSTGGGGTTGGGTTDGGTTGGGTGSTGGTDIFGTTGSQNQICPTNCGIAPQYTGVNRIVGGAQANIGEYPWMALVMVMVEDNEIGACGGSIVTRNHVISAAHCFAHERLDGATVIVGEHDVTKQNEANTQRIYASSFIKHSNYDDKTQANDIVILILSEPIIWTPQIGPLCLATMANYDGYLAIVTGWGVTTARTSSTLQEVAVRVLKQEECQTLYEGNYVITDKQVCAAAPGKDSCQGDSGGPMVVMINNRWYHLGIVSFGIGCAQANFPGVYTYIPNYRDWILGHVASGLC